MITASTSSRAIADSTSASAATPYRPARSGARRPPATATSSPSGTWRARHSAYVAPMNPAPRIAKRKINLVYCRQVVLSVLASAEEQAASVEANLAAIQAHYATEVFDRDGIRFCFSGLKWRVLNGAVLAHLDQPKAEGRIAETLAWFRERSVPWRWIVGPLSAPPDLGTRLVGAGMRAASDHPGMVLRLDRMRDEPPDLAGLEVREVVDETDFGGWADVQRDTWGLS